MHLIAHAHALKRTQMSQQFVRIRPPLIKWSVVTTGAIKYTRHEKWDLLYWTSLHSPALLLWRAWPEWFAVPPMIRTVEWGWWRIELGIL